MDAAVLYVRSDSSKQPSPAYLGLLPSSFTLAQSISLRRLSYPLLTSLIRSTLSTGPSMCRLDCHVWMMSSGKSSSYSLHHGLQPHRIFNLSLDRQSDVSESGPALVIRIERRHLMDNELLKVEIDVPFTLTAS